MFGALPTDGPVVSGLDLRAGTLSVARHGSTGMRQATHCEGRLLVHMADI